jgi:hypothetical protein
MYADERKAIEGLFQSQFVASNPTILVAWEGRRFDKPGLDTNWVSLIIRSNGEPIQASLGDNPWIRHYSYIQVSINVQADKGVAAAEVIADAIHDVFSLKEITVGANGRIQCRPSYRNSLGVRDGKYTMIMTIPYIYDNLN